MRLWRLVKEAYVGSVLSGQGGLFSSGRWHHQGTLIVYLSSTPSLCALEFLVHVDPALAPARLAMVEVDVPDDLPVEAVPADALPPGWRSYPAPAVLADFGTTWARSQRTPLLQVPSAVNPVAAENNVLLNPLHPLAPRVTVVGSSFFSFDPRLL